MHGNAAARLRQRPELTNVYVSLDYSKPEWQVEIDRTRAALVTDPAGCWVAEVDGEVVGGAVSRVRELMWILASFAVRPDQQGRGIGAQLKEDKLKELFSL